MRRGRVFKIFAVLVVLIIGYLLFNLAVVWNTANSNHYERSDAIVVLGAAQFNGKPSAVFRARLDEALRLYRDDKADKIVVSGGKKPGDRVTEATAGANYLIARGIYDHNILREVAATNTWEELESISQIAKQNDIDTVILVSDGFHLARARAIARHFGLQAYTSVADTSPIRGANAFGRIVRESAALSAARIIGYDRVYKVESKLKKADTG